MERKIGEIFEYNGEWYQCVKSPDGSCKHCDMNFGGKCPIPIKECVASARKDATYAIFKKLEKVEEPVTEKGKAFQRLNALKTECTGCVFLNSERGCDKVHYIDGPCPNREIWVEIKQNKEDMEEKKKRLDDLVGLYSSAQMTYKEFDKELRALYSDKEEIKSILKPFDIEAAKAGKPVCTRDGRKARIICFDRDWDMHIVALVACPTGESLQCYLSDGRIDFDKQNDKDLMMLPEKKEGWVNVYKDSVYDTKNEALIGRSESRGYIDTIKVSWEE